MTASLIAVSMGAAGIGAVTGTTTASAAACSLPATVSGAADTTLGQQFSQYGNVGTGTTWTGADGPSSVVLPDGRTLWLFDDTFFGTVSATFLRSHATLVRNTGVIQDTSGALTGTLYDSSGSKPAAWVAAPPPAGKTKAPKSLGLWPRSAVVEGDQLFVTMSEYKFAQQTFNLKFEGNWIAAFQLTNGQDPAFESLSPVSTTVVDWGPMLVDGGTTYVYGYYGGQAFVAQAPNGLTNAWLFWTGSAWDLNEANLQPIAQVGTGYNVAKVGNAYALVTMGESVIGFSPNVDVSFSCSPTGAFSTFQTAYTAPEPTPGFYPTNYKTIVTYGAHAQPAVADGASTLEVSYDVRPLKGGKGLKDVNVYRPRYVTLSLGY